MHKLLQQDLSIMKLATVQGCLMYYSGIKMGKLYQKMGQAKDLKPEW